MPDPLPLFGLNAPLVPGLVLPLHIFEPRYRDLVAALLDRPREADREFGIIAVRDGRDPATEGSAALYPVGTSVLLRDVTPLEDGRFDIVTVGHRRFRVTSVDASRPLLTADVDWLEDVTSARDEPAARAVAAAFGAYRDALAGQVGPDHHGVEELPTDPTVLSYLVTAAVVVPVGERQDLLAAPTTHARLVAAGTLLRRETALIGALGCLPAVDLTIASASAN